MENQFLQFLIEEKNETKRRCQLYDEISSSSTNEKKLLNSIEYGNIKVLQLIKNKALYIVQNLDVDPCFENNILIVFDIVNDFDIINQVNLWASSKSPTEILNEYGVDRTNIVLAIYLDEDYCSHSYLCDKSVIKHWLETNGFKDIFNFKYIELPEELTSLTYTKKQMN